MSKSSSVCKKKGCDKPVVAHDLCMCHYQRKRREKIKDNSWKVKKRKTRKAKTQKTVAKKVKTTELPLIERVEYLERELASLRQLLLGDGPKVTPAQELGPKRGRPSREIPTKKRLWQLLKTCVSVDEMAREEECAKPTMEKWIEHHGLPKPSQVK